MSHRTSRTEQTMSRASVVLHRIETGLWGLGILGLSVLALLALLSFSRTDGRGADTANWIGPVGDSLARLMLSATGIGAYLLIGSTLAMGVQLMKERLGRIRGRTLAGSGLILISVMILAHLLIEDRWPTSYWPEGGGGLIGALSGEMLVALLGTVGTVLVSLLLLVAGGSLAAHRPPQILLRSASRPLAGLARQLRVLVDRLWAELVGWRNQRLRSAVPGRATESEQLIIRSRETTCATSAQEPPPFPEVEICCEDFPEDEEEEQAPTSWSRTGPADLTARTRVMKQATPPPIPTRESEVPILEKPAFDYLDEPPADEATLAVQPKTPAGKMLPTREDAPRSYRLPELDLLDKHPPIQSTIDRDYLQESARVLTEKLRDFKVSGEVVGIHPGPVISLFEFRPGRAVKVSQIANLSKDLAMALAAEQVRVIAPIPGKDVVGIEVPNRVREMVYLRDLLSHKTYKDSRHQLPIVLGKDISGRPTVSDLAKMPHLLIAGTTGSGKSVAMHAFLMSILYRLTPDQVRFILIDPKMLEMTSYSDIPHLLHPVVTDAKDAAVALRWLVGEMERRNKLMSEAGVPNIAEYNEAIAEGRDLTTFSKSPRPGQLDLDLEERKPLPFIVVVIDELADLMMVAGKQVETSIARLAQMGRAGGIHMMIATQNPTIKVMTGIIKANMPARVSFKVRSMQDSRVILDQNGADDLLGYGDMLFLPPGSSKLARIHGSFVSTEERTRTMEMLRAQGEPEYNHEIMAAFSEEGDEDEDGGVDGTRGSSGGDALYEEAVAMAVQLGRISTSKIQQQLGIGYNRAARIMAKMERAGLVGPPEAAGKPRIVLLNRIP